MEENQKLDLKLNEDNELSFRLSIEGTVSDPDLAPPNFRFTIMETGTGTRGWIFPAVKEDDDIVRVKIPAPLKEGFASNRSYHGKLEVIIGRLYFSPAEMMLEFSAPLSVKAEALNKSITVTNPSNKVVATVISNKPPIQKPVSLSTPAKPSVPVLEEKVDFSDSELAEILSVIRERQQPSQNTASFAPKSVIQRRIVKPEPVPVVTPRPTVEAPVAPNEVPPQSLRNSMIRTIEQQKATKPAVVSALRPNGPSLQEKDQFRKKFMSIFREALTEVKK